METVMMIQGELEHLESLVKVARKKKDAEAASNQVSMVATAPTIKRLSINKMHRSKTLHLLVEVNSYLVEGLVDIGTSMSVMAAIVRSDSKTNVRDGANALRYAPANSDAVDAMLSLWEHGTNERMMAREFESNSDSNEDSNKGT
ncbi:unnamed protein product [Sphagnum balticum]